MIEENPLLIVHDTISNRRWENTLTERHLSIGRGEECDLTLPDRQVSRLHASIVRQPEGFFLRDEGSRNGTFLNGRMIGLPRPLRDGDEISIAARYRMIFVASEATAPLYRPGPSRQGLHLDPTSRRVWVEGVEIDPPLSEAQHRLLVYLYRHAGDGCSREEIVDAVWVDAIGGVSDEAIDALVGRLRGRLAETGTEHDYIETIRGFGYRLKLP